MIGSDVPWQTNEKQVGAFAYCEGLPKRGCVKGFAYAEGSGPDTKTIRSSDPSWQTALVVIEMHLDVRVIRDVTDMPCGFRFMLEGLSSQR